VLRFHAWHLLAGFAAAALTYAVSWTLMGWMGAITLGLLLSPLLTWWTARPAGRLLSFLLATAHDRNLAPILLRARERARDWALEQPSDPPRGAPSLPKAA
jgi:membrane glycosyltransferase